MPCEHIHIPGGGSAIICTRGGRPKRCQFCGKPCTKECDFPDGKRRSGTCDAKMCDRCATSGGVEIDYCPAHAPFVFAVADRRVIVASLRELKVGERLDRGHSVLANPFRLVDVNNEDDRRLAYKNYRHWLWGRINTPDSTELAELLRLVAMASEQDVVLLCHCTPRICHGQVVAKAMQWLYEQKK